MTCIVGFIDEEKTIHMAGDRMSMAGYDRNIRASPKIFIVRNTDQEPIVIGVTGYVRLNQLLQYKLKIPGCPANMGMEEYMVVHVAEAVRACLKDAAFVKVENSQECHEGRALVGYKGRLFELQGYYQMCEDMRSYAAIGSGADFACGALHALQGASGSVRDRLFRAMDAATEFNAGVHPPYDYIRLNKDGMFVEERGDGTVSYNAVWLAPTEIEKKEETK